MVPAAAAPQGSSQNGVATPLGSSPPRSSASVPPVPGSATPLSSGMAAVQANGVRIALISLPLVFHFEIYPC